ncbi:MAG: serine/threonine protein kinase [Planctomycetes bacterium]|nr:serine/threonine protein kinase [Planctomycetota bacterium]
MSITKSCPRCGAGLSAPEELQGLCASCVLIAALEPNAEEGGEPARRPAPSIEELARHFPDLELLELVGQGGMGAVYRVRQTKLGREAALKVLALDAVATPAFGERFEREARTLASLDHENIVQVYDAGRAGPWWYLLMEYVDGVSLRQMIRAHEVDPRTALALVAQVCDALQCAHDHGVVHRDIKPENVLVDRKGRAKILDFGLAKLLGREPRTGTLTETGQVMGTPRYMAPEQWERPLSVDHRADIYSIGVVFYELLTGELPIGAFALPSQKGAPDARVDSVVMKTLAKEPERRYQHASEVRTAVRSIESTPPPLAAPTRAADEAPVRKNDLKRVAWIALSMAGCVTLLLIPLGGLMLFTARLDSTQEAQVRAAHEAMAAHEALAEQMALAEAARREAELSETPNRANEPTARIEGRVSRSALMGKVGSAPRIDRARARSLHWTDDQMDLADAMADLAWCLNLSRAESSVEAVSAEGATVRFVLRAQPEVHRAHQRLLEAVSHCATTGIERGGRDGATVVTGYSFAGEGFSVLVDATDVVRWSIDTDALEVAARAAARTNAPLAAPDLSWFFAYTGLAAWPNYGLDEWRVEVELTDEPHGWVERQGARTELDAAALRGPYRVLLAIAREHQPR